MNYSPFLKLGAAVLAHAGLLAIFDLVRDAGALVALGAHDLHLGSVHGSLTLHDAAGREFGRAVTQWCIIDLGARKAIDLNTVIGTCADSIVDAPSPTEKPRKVTGIVPQHIAEHRVVYSDIDFNRHVNTMRYINMMFDMLPIEQLTAIRPVRLDIHFMHECRYGQTLTVGYEQRDGLSLFEVSNGEEAAVRAALEWR